MEATEQNGKKRDDSGRVKAERGRGEDKCCDGERRGRKGRVG